MPGITSSRPTNAATVRPMRPRKSTRTRSFISSATSLGLVGALGEQQAVIVGHDWGAPVAWNAALWRPDIFRAVAALSVPFSDRAPIAPTAGMRALFGDNFFYILYFQRPGVAEHELQHNVRATLRRLLFGGSGNAPDRGINSMMRIRRRKPRTSSISSPTPTYCRPG